MAHNADIAFEVATMKRTVVLGMILAASGPLLQGCAAVLAGGAVTTATVARDQRTAGTILDDSRIESKAGDFFAADAELSQQAHLNVTAHNGMVLLVGQTPTEDLKKRAVEYVSRVAKVRHIYDELTVQAPIPTLTRTNDGLITTKVKAKLVSIKDVNSTDVKVVTENGVVYLMGLLDQPTGDAVAEVVAGLSGVSKVVKLFEAPNAPRT